MTHEEVLAMIRESKSGEKPPMLMSCRSAEEPLGPGCIRHYHCKVCGKEVQVTPKGREMVIAGAITLCGPCAMDLLEKRSAAGGKSDVVLGEYAFNQIVHHAMRGDKDAQELLLEFARREKERERK